MTAAEHTPGWFESYDEVVLFARVLVATFDWDADNLLSYLEKPWKWTPEHADWCAEGRKESLTKGKTDDRR